MKQSLSHAPKDAQFPGAPIEKDNSFRGALGPLF